MTTSCWAPAARGSPPHTSRRAAGYVRDPVPLADPGLGEEHLQRVGDDLLEADHVGVPGADQLEKTAGARDARAAVASSSTKLRVVAPDHPEAPIAGGGGVTLTPVVPSVWPAECIRAEEPDPNACSIALRIDYCKSSVLFTGDAPKEEDELLGTRGEVTLLQVSRHGSKTSTSEALLTKARPKYAVISAAKPGEGTNDRYCHPRSVVVETLTKAMGGAGTRKVKAFDGAAKCKQGDPQAERWLEVPASDRLWVTARDGDLTLTTIGDGVFTRE